MKKQLILFLLSIFLFTLYGCETQNNSDNSYSESTTEVITWQTEYDLGMKLFRDGNYQGAILSFESAIKLDASKPEAFVKRANAIILSAETDENLTLALNDYQLALELDKANVEAHLGIADVFIRQGSYEKAVESLKDALDITNQNNTIKTKLSEIDSGVFTDSNNNPRLELHYYGNEKKLVGYIEFVYAENGELFSVSGYSANGTPAGYVETKITIKDNMTEEITYGVHQELDSYFYVLKKIIKKSELPDGSHIIIDTNFNKYDEITDYSYTTYNSSWKCLAFESYSNNGSLQERRTHEYNHEGYNSRINYYDENNSLTSFHLIEYDSNGNKTKMAYHSGSGALVKYSIHEYNEKGILTGHKDYNSNNELESYYKYIFNKNGDIVGWELYDSNGNLTYSTETK